MKKVYAKLTLVLLICALMFAISSCELVDQVKDILNNHQYVEEITKAPTCSEEGVKTFTCACGDSYTETIEKLPHTEEVVPAVAPTCTEAGLTEGKKCSVCEEVIVAQQTVAANGHTESDPVQENIVDSTCSAEGSYDSVVYCSVCDAEISRTPATIEKKPHTEVTDAAVEATCTEAGKTEGKHCSVCGEVTVAQEVAPAKGHTDSEPVQENVVDSSCSEEGTYDSVVYCSVCDAEISRTPATIEKKAHTEVIDAAVEATCTKTGLTEGKHCSVCGEVIVAQEVVAQTEHTYSDEWKYDDTQHWHECTGTECDAKDYGNHDAYNATCVCGYVSAYKVVNGNFENGLEGWTLNNTLGEKPFGGIDEKSTFWGEAYPMFNVGKYFSAYAEGAEEHSQGSLASSYFVVNSEYATYMLGGAGNHNVYITIENKNGDVLALYRNTKFRDLSAEDNQLSVDERRELIGNTVFLANFVTYKVDLTAWEGEEIRFVIHDYASSGWGVVYFDQLNTYYASADQVPEIAILADNLLANKDALNAELALEITEQGDYTADSYNTYIAKLAEAKALVNDIAVTQENVDKAVSALTEARLALAIRPIVEVEGANKSFNLVSGNEKEINIADYVNTNELSNITFEVQAANGLVTLSPVADGKFTITAGTVTETKTETVSIVVSYNGEVKLTVVLSVQITNDVAPSVFNGEVVKNYDLYELDNKTNITIDLSENVDNAGNLPLTYYVNGEKLEGTTYTFAFGSYNDVAANETFAVTIAYVANGESKSISYDYTLALKDTTANRLVNGDFESGLEGWTQVGNIGGVSSDKTYWNEGIEFGMDGANMFSAYAPGALESAVGTLMSSSFKVGGSGFVTFKVGAMRDQNYVYVDVVDAETKQILARYFNGLWTDADLSGCKLVAYKADLSAFVGKEVFFRISDNADSGYGLFFADSFVTYYESEPADFNAATPVDYTVSGTIYDVFNGGFEMGGNQGWWNNGEIGVVTNANGYWGDNISYEKVGDYLFTGVESFGADTMREGNRGALTSSVFEIGGTGYISFKLGGGGSELCYVQVIDAVTGEVLARYHQQAQQDAKLIQYVADLSAYIGRTARIQVVDQADSGWGCVSFDHVVTYYASADSLPEGLTANDIKGDLKYTIDNGSFETGNIDGWTMNITEAGAHNTLGWVLETEIDAGWYTKNDDTKDGKFLFTFAQPGDINCENTKGTLQSSTFSLKQGSFVSFKFGAAGGAQNHDVYIELCRADGSVIARFFNDAPGKVNTRMNSYFYQYNGVEVNCFFRVVDNSTGDYGCLVIDDFRVNLDSAPEGYIAAIQ